MCIEKEHQTWLLVGHNVDQNLYLQQPFPCKQVDIFLGSDDTDEENEYVFRQRLFSSIDKENSDEDNI